jgi:hypothetical protein
MMLSAWFTVAWFFSRGTDAMRPSALHRMFALIWLFVGSFVLLTFVTVLAQNFQLAGGYWALFYFAAVFAALLLSYIELFLAPKKSAFARTFEATEEESPSSSRPITASGINARSEDRPVAEDDATETTSLLRGDRRSFARYGSRRGSASEGTAGHDEEGRRVDVGEPYPGEQEWSGKLPSWIWVLQLWLVAPIVVVLVGQIALLLTSALYQTPSDGNSSLFIYLSFAALSVLLVAPAGPFLHRFTYHVPTFLFLVCVATVIYNLMAFPFSREHRLKVYFVQQVDLDTGANTVSLTGLDGYVQEIVGQLPSAQGQEVNCSSPEIATRKELKKCGWQGLPAKVVPALQPYSGNGTHVNKWVEFTVTKDNGTNSATMRVVGQNTRACRILFDEAVHEVRVDGAVSDVRFEGTGKEGAREVRLWHREWSQAWTVRMAWSGGASWKPSGRVVCLWSDANGGGIPAFDEVQHYVPVWAIASKISDGLVEGFKRFQV